HAHAAREGRCPVPLHARDAAVEDRPRLDRGHVQRALSHGRDVLHRRPGEHGVPVFRRNVEHRCAEGRAAERRRPTDCHGSATVSPRRPVRHHPTGCLPSMTMTRTVRDATEADAAACAAIYAPYVRDTAITFETEPPDAAEFARRIAAATARHAW